MGTNDGDGPDIHDLQGRVARYEEAGPLHRATLRLSHQVPDAVERERVRRHRLRIEGRIAEDVAEAVHASAPIWELLVQKGLPEDLSVRELNEIRNWLLGRHVPHATSVTSVSIRFNLNPARIEALAATFPGDFVASEVTAYRYATVTSEDGAEEPFIVALRQLTDGRNIVLATMLMGAVFLRHEQEFGALEAGVLGTLANTVALDLQTIADTHRALLGA
ncbi:MAG: hypothetical protein QOF68_708 [Gaiellales bacterium]|jgi:hypothetical protein|nr:hypothetical protein [Gaiellales bacterium]